MAQHRAASWPMVPFSAKPVPLVQLNIMPLLPGYLALLRRYPRAQRRELSRFKSCFKSRAKWPRPRAPDAPDPKANWDLGAREIAPNDADGAFRGSVKWLVLAGSAFSLPRLLFLSSIDSFYRRYVPCMYNISDLAPVYPIYPIHQKD